LAVFYSLLRQRTLKPLALLLLFMLLLLLLKFRLYPLVLLFWVLLQ